MSCALPCTTPSREARFGQAGLGLRSTLDLGDKLPPSPSDPQLNLDLRKTALLRSLLLRTEARCADALPTARYHASWGRYRSL